MKRRRHWVTVAPSTQTTRSQWLSYGLPPGQLAKARARLVQLLWVFLLLGIFGASSTSLGLLTGRFQFSHHVALAVSTHLAALVLSGALILFARNPDRPHELILNLGLAFEVVVSAIVSLTTPVLVYSVFQTVPPLTWVAVVVLMFTLIVPGPPRRMLVAAGFSCAMPPLAIRLLHANGVVDVTAPQLGAVFMSHLLILPMAYFGSRIIYRLSTEAAEAEQIGSYQLKSKIGEGGMGEVWRGEHQLLARPAAIKLIRPDRIARGSRDDEVSLQRFEREAQVTASLESLHTVKVYDYGITDDGQVYYVMELLRGIDLERLVREFEPLPPERVVYFLQQICESLAEAHDAGVTHRDIKPSNILACRYAGQVDVIKVVDFGLASLMGSDRNAPQLTAEQNVVGTPAYMAPEQIKEHDATSPQSDIYNIGCVAFWLLTGRHLFEADTAVEVLAAHIHEPAAPPSSLREDLPSELDQLVIRCVAKRPEDRPASADELRELLAQIPCEPWTAKRARSWWDTHNSRLL